MTGGGDDKRPRAQRAPKGRGRGERADPAERANEARSERETLQALRPESVTVDPWHALRAHTPARIALGRSGVSLPTREVLAFGCAHAQARDAVQRPLDADALERELNAAGFATLRVHSAAPDRATYLLRPDLGRRLDEASRAALAERAPTLATFTAADWLLPVVGDGLSSLAVARHALPTLQALRTRTPPGWALGPVVVALQARVALADEIGAALHAPLTAMLIGERPGLSSPDSLGIYLTAEPKRGRSDAERNCISTIRPEGLSFMRAAHTLWWLAQAARRGGGTGVRLKDASGALALDG